MFPIRKTNIFKVQSNGNVKTLTPRQVADLLGHNTSEITERYYVKKDNKRLIGITEGFEMQLRFQSFLS